MGSARRGSWQPGGQPRAAAGGRVRVAAEAGAQACARGRPQHGEIRTRWGAPEAGALGLSLWCGRSMAAAFCRVPCCLGMVLGSKTPSSCSSCSELWLLGFSQKGWRPLPSGGHGVWGVTAVAPGWGSGVGQESSGLGLQVRVCQAGPASRAWSLWSCV